MSRLPVDLVPFPSLAGLSTAGRELVARTREPFELGPRQPVIHCGQSVAGTYFVTAGDLRVFVQDAEGREKTLYHVRPGQTCILAVNAAFARVVYPAWVASGEEPTRGFILPATTYRELFATEPVLRDFTVEVLSSWVFDLMTAVEQGALRSMPERIAHVLVRRADGSGRVRATHADLAADLGSAREVVSRHLASFEERGLLRRGRGELWIDDPRALLAGSAEDFTG